MESKLIYQFISEIFNLCIFWLTRFFKRKLIYSVRLAWLILPTYFTIQFFFLLFMSPTALFGTIYKSHYTISVNF